MSNPGCGDQTELLSTNTVRVMRCSCGTVHLTLVAPGVTLRMSPDMLREIATALPAAVEAMTPKLEVTTGGAGGAGGARCAN